MSYLLFVRTTVDLDRACREVSEFFAFQHRQASFVCHELHGIWIDPDAVLHVPHARLANTADDCDRSFWISESFGVAGVWQLAWLHALEEVQSDQEMPDRIIESLRGLERGGSGLFAPVFPRGETESAINETLTRLWRRYPDSFAAPLVQDPANGALEPMRTLGIS